MSYRESAYVCEECLKKTASPPPTEEVPLAVRKLIYWIRLLLAIMCVAVGSILIDNSLLARHTLYEGAVVALAIVQFAFCVAVCGVVGDHISDLK